MNADEFKPGAETSNSGRTHEARKHLKQLEKKLQEKLLWLQTTVVINFLVVLLAIIKIYVRLGHSGVLLSAGMLIFIFSLLFIILQEYWNACIASCGDRRQSNDPPFASEEDLNTDLTQLRQGVQILTGFVAGLLLFSFIFISRKQTIFPMASFAIGMICYSAGIVLLRNVASTFQKIAKRLYLLKYHNRPADNHANE
jgi:hypothetical protein